MAGHFVRGIRSDPGSAPRDDSRRQIFSGRAGDDATPQLAALFGLRVSGDRDKLGNATAEDVGSCQCDGDVFRGPKSFYGQVSGRDSREILRMVFGGVLL